jgi:RNA-directed DNA polymerase
MTEDKPFWISKWAVLRAWHKVRANEGAAGVDGVSVEGFEQKLKNNLYRIWNRMSSGSYLPPPVRRVLIPKADGRQRPLGIPTVGDRVAQMVVKLYLEPKVEPLFHPDSYGYRPGKSALEAVGTCRTRCWRYDWVVERGHQRVLRQHRSLADDARGPQAYGLPVGAAVHRALAQGACRS